MIWDLIKASFGWHLKSHQRQSFPLHWAKKSLSAEISLFSWNVPFIIFIVELSNLLHNFFCQQYIYGDNFFLSSMIIIVIWVCHRVLCLLCEGFQVASSAKSSNYRSLSSTSSSSSSSSTPAIYILAEKINSDLLTLTPLLSKLNWTYIVHRDQFNHHTVSQNKRTASSVSSISSSKLGTK